MVWFSEDVLKTGELHIRKNDIIFAFFYLGITFRNDF